MELASGGSLIRWGWGVFGAAPPPPPPHTTHHAGRCPHHFVRGPCGPRRQGWPLHVQRDHLQGVMQGAALLVARRHPPRVPGRLHDRVRPLPKLSPCVQASARMAIRRERAIGLPSPVGRTRVMVHTTVARLPRGGTPRAPRCRKGLRITPTRDRLRAGSTGVQRCCTHRRGSVLARGDVIAVPRIAREAGALANTGFRVAFGSRRGGRSLGRVQGR
jgi:hypothetical protein